MSYRNALLLSLLLIGVVGAATLSVCWSPRPTSGTASAIGERSFEVPADTLQARFDAVRWRAHRYDNTRAEMVNDLLRTHSFQAWTRSDVVALLGPPEVGGRPENETYILMQL